MERKLITMLLLFDFSKAIDTVCHLNFLRKLRAVGFSRSALKWIASFLTGMEQPVIDDTDHLTLNLTKTKAIVINSYYNIKLLATSPNWDLTLGETFIAFESLLRNLCVIFDFKLNLKDQVSSIRIKAYLLLYSMNF